MKTLLRPRYFYPFLLGCLLFFGFLFDGHKSIVGHWRGEAFFAGRPSSYWNEAIHAYFHRAPPHSKIEEWLNRIGIEFNRQPPAVVYHPDGLPVLLELLADSDGDVEVRRVIAAALSEDVAGRARDVVTPALVAALDDKHVSVRCTAGCALWMMETQVDLAGPFVLEALEMGGSERIGAMVALLKAGPPAIPTLRRAALKSKDRFVRNLAADSLTKVAKRHPETKDEIVSILVERCNDANIFDRLHAKKALSDLDPEMAKKLAVAD
jgi:hypothetical protein